MATRSSILAWRIPWTKEPGGPQSGESQESNAAKQLRTHTNRYRYMDIYLNVCVNIIHIFEYMYEQNRGFPGGSGVTNLPVVQEVQVNSVQSLGWEDPLEEEMVTHSSFLAWRIPWTEEPGVLQSMGLQRVGHD